MTGNERVDAAVIAHDLGNLLQITAGALLQIDRHLDEGTRARVRRFEYAASESLARAGALSRALVDRGRRTQTICGPTCPAQVLRAIQQLIELAAGPAISVDFEVSEKVPEIACSVAELERALLNLVANARDSMPGGGTLVISMVREEDSAVLRIRDSGCGMTAQVAAQAFRPHFTTKSGTGGAGLGLAMVRGFAERAGGSAEVDSVVGAGTMVSLRLPGAGSGLRSPPPLDV
jgi:signal transduction histidine kinase